MKRANAMMTQNFFIRWSCVFLFVIALCGQTSTIAQTATLSSSSQAKVTVPFVGCNSDGQVGPIKAPLGYPKTVRLSADVAHQFAYYKAEDGPGVLAPRGWYCFSTYGSNGSSLFVSLTPIASSKLFSLNWKGFEGPVIQISYEYGDTSGRFGVAAMIARVFPAYKGFVKEVMDEDVKAGINPANSYPIGPYPKDKLTYHSQRIVEYQTPAKSDGLGTNSRLQKNALPIYGVEILTGQTPDLISLAVRLPQNDQYLAPLIIREVERESAR